MIGAIGSAPAAGFAQADSTAALESQLARCQTQLADWTHCPSSRTPEGKAKIQALQDQQAQLQRRLDVDQRRVAAKDDASGTRAQAASSPQTSIGPGPAVQGSSFNGGAQIDVYV